MSTGNRRFEVIERGSLHTITAERLEVMVPSGNLAIYNGGRMVGQHRTWDSYRELSPEEPSPVSQAEGRHGIDTTNEFAVGVQGECIIIIFGRKLVGQPLTRERALRLAAWVVRMAQGLPMLRDSEHGWEEILKAVRLT